MDAILPFADPQLIDGTIRDLTAAVDRLEAEKAARQKELADLDAKIAETQARIRSWQNCLSKLTHQSTNDDRQRLRKGEALQRINDLFDKVPPGSGLSWSEIARQSGVPWSSVRNVLRREGSGYYEVQGNWFRGKMPEVSTNGTH